MPDDPRRTLLVQKMVAEGTSDDDIRATLKVFDTQQRPATPAPSATSRFVSNAWDVLNPMQIIASLNQLLHEPVATGANIAAQQTNEARKALEMASQGRGSEASGHAAAAMIPILGPQAAQAGEQIASGDWAGGAGRGLALTVPAVAPSIIKGVTKGVSTIAPEGLSAALERGATTRVADVMSPKVGANKVRFGNAAEKAAPELLKRGDVGGFSREGLHGDVQAKLAESQKALDAVSNARLSARTFDTKPILDALLERRKRLTAETVEAGGVKSGVIEGLQDTSKPGSTPNEYGNAPRTSATEQTGKPFGQDVVPAPNAARVTQIDQAIQEIKALGPSARYESLRRIREAYDGPASVKYNPSMTADFLKAQGGASGAADVTGALRESLAKFDPETAAANADYSVYRRANDVLEATREVERTRPRVGRQLIARWAGAATGGEAAGLPGAVTGYLLGPVVESMTSMGVTTKLQTARLMSGLADAIKTGDVTRVNGLAAKIRRLTGSTILSRATSPNESQKQPVPALVPQGIR